jgi:hypothetical protein
MYEGELSDAATLAAFIADSYPGATATTYTRDEQTLPVVRLESKDENGVSVARFVDVTTGLDAYAPLEAVTEKYIADDGLEAADLEAHAWLGETLSQFTPAELAEHFGQPVAVLYSRLLDEPVIYGMESDEIIGVIMQEAGIPRDPREQYKDLPAVDVDALIKRDAKRAEDNGFQVVRTLENGDRVLVLHASAAGTMAMITNNPDETWFSMTTKPTKSKPAVERENGKREICEEVYRFQLAHSSTGFKPLLFPGDVESDLRDIDHGTYVYYLTARARAELLKGDLTFKTGSQALTIDPAKPIWVISSSRNMIFTDTPDFAIAHDYGISSGTQVIMAWNTDSKESQGAQMYEITTDKWASSRIYSSVIDAMQANWDARGFTYNEIGQ